MENPLEPPEQFSPRLGRILIEFGERVARESKEFDGDGKVSKAEVRQREDDLMAELKSKLGQAELAWLLQRFAEN